MSCHFPLRAVQSVFPNSEGKRPVQIVGRLRMDGKGEAVVYEGPAWRNILLPCGSCLGCKLERSRQWAMRCMHEADMYLENCFITLTYDDAHLPYAGSLNLDDFQKFMKRLRKRYEDRRIRFFHCGEYGEKFGRPHYHACLFGFDFPDKILLGERNGLPVWRSSSLESLWSFGRSEIGSVTFESAAYVARYVLKKVSGIGAEEHYGLRAPEYITMSRRPGIGGDWIRKYGDDVYGRDGVYVRGKLSKPPRYYDVVRELINPGEMELIRQKRREEAEPPDSLQVLASKGAIAQSRVSLYAKELD